MCVSDLTHIRPSSPSYDIQESRVVDVVTQSMLIDFLWQNLEEIGKAADIPVRDIGSFSTPLVVQVYLLDVISSHFT